jgi:Replication initiator protein A
VGQGARIGENPGGTQRKRESGQMAGSLAAGPRRGGGLLPDRHPVGDFFLCDVLDAIPKDDMATMEHPVFSLATRPDLRVLDYAALGPGVGHDP